MSYTPECETPGCRRVSVHVLVERSLLFFKRVRRLCPGCYDAEARSDA